MHRILEVDAPRSSSRGYLAGPLVFLLLIPVCGSEVWRTAPGASGVLRLRGGKLHPLMYPWLLRLEVRNARVYMCVSAYWRIRFVLCVNTRRHRHRHMQTWAHMYTLT